MAKTATIKVLKSPRSHWQLIDGKYTGDEPVWNTEAATAMTDEAFDNAVRKSMNYYNYYFSAKDLKKYVDEFVKISGLFKDKEIKAFEKVADKDVPITLCSLIVAHKNGMPLRGQYNVYILETIKKLMGDIEPVQSQLVAQKPVTNVINIQDRLSEKTNELMGHIEAELDNVLLKKTSAFKAFDFLSNNNVPQSQLTKYENVFGNIKAEFKEAQTSSDEQLQEAYQHLKNSDYKRINEFLQGVLDAVDQYRAVKRTTKKARAKKPVNKQKLVSKMKFAKEFKALKLVSINPVDILGAEQLWVYNTKTRKLGRYVAADYATLSVKGTSIINFNEHKSIAKTLRKPEDKLKEFAKAGKVQLRKFIEDIRSVETKLNGRINQDCVLLKII